MRAVHDRAKSCSGRGVRNGKSASLAGLPTVGCASPRPAARNEPRRSSTRLGVWRRSGMADERGGGSRSHSAVGCSARPSVGLLVGVALAWFVPWQLAVLAGWDVVAVLVLLRVWSRVSRFSPDETKEFATREDDSRVSAEFLLVAASVASLAGAAFGLLKAHESGPTLEAVLTAASVLTVALSWAVVHTVFALRYAHEYYTPTVPGAIDFKSGDYEPDYGDFAYVAFTVGMTFQVSDTDIGSRLIRRTVLRHALLSYLFGAIIVALMVNVIATLINH